MWIEPKTTWRLSDFVNLSDYERWVGNVSHLHLMASEFKKVELEPMAEGKTIYDMPYAEEFNAIENNVQSVNINRAQIDKKKTWNAGLKTPNSDDYNRLEQAMINIYDSIKPSYDLIPKLSFTFGGGIKC